MLVNILFVCMFVVNLERTPVFIFQLHFYFFLTRSFTFFPLHFNPILPIKDIYFWQAAYLFLFSFNVIILNLRSQFWGILSCRGYLAPHLLLRFTHPYIYVHWYKTKQWFVILLLHGPYCPHQTMLRSYFVVKNMKIGFLQEFEVQFMMVFK